jgi:hypothetical protein
VQVRRGARPFRARGTCVSPALNGSRACPCAPRAGWLDHAYAWGCAHSAWSRGAYAPRGQPWTHAGGREHVGLARGLRPLEMPCLHVTAARHLNAANYCNPASLVPRLRLHCYALQALTRATPLLAAGGAARRRHGRGWLCHGDQLHGATTRSEECRRPGPGLEDEQAASRQPGRRACARGGRGRRHEHDALGRDDGACTPHERPRTCMTKDLPGSARQERKKERSTPGGIPSALHFKLPGREREAGPQQRDEEASNSWPARVLATPPAGKVKVAPPRSCQPETSTAAAPALLTFTKPGPPLGLHITAGSGTCAGCASGSSGWRPDGPYKLPSNCSVPAGVGARGAGRKSLTYLCGCRQLQCWPGRVDEPQSSTLASVCQALACRTHARAGTLL